MRVRRARLLSGQRCLRLLLDRRGGCPFSAPVDAGSDAAVAKPPAPLLCTSYRNCNNYDQCCYAPDLGSSCKDKCGAGLVSLCEVGRDNCAPYRGCKNLTISPQPNIGQCDFSSSGGGSSSGWR